MSEDSRAFCGVGWGGGGGVSDEEASAGGLVLLCSTLVTFPFSFHRSCEGSSRADLSPVGFRAEVV